MKQKFEAIREAITFIKNNWIDKSDSYWEGAPHEFVGATLFGGVTKTDIKQIIKAINSGEPIEVDSLSGEIAKNRLVKVRVMK